MITCHNESPHRLPSQPPILNHLNQRPPAARKRIAALRLPSIAVLATQLIKVACEAAVGQCDCVTVFGGDYDTPDGTCYRLRRLETHHRS